MRALAILPFAFVIPLAEALADHAWLYAAPLGVLVAVGLFELAPAAPAASPPAATTGDSVAASEGGL